MELDKAIQNALDGNAILFLGSGFSVGATNKIAENFVNAANLSKEMCKAIGIKESTELAVVSSRFIDDSTYGKGIDAFISFLKNQFICTHTTPVQDFILQVPWKRIYTTNYDNVVEVSSRKQNILRQSITATVPANSMDNIDGAIIHMNGYIINLTPEKFYEEFKITEENYLNTGFLDSAWGGQFEHDIDVCKNIFFVGYSMKYDLDLQKVLYGRIHDKSIFVENLSIDDNQEYRLNKWGSLYKIASEGFARKINEVRSYYVPIKSKYEFKSVREIRPDEYVVKKIDASNVIDFLVTGKYDRLWMRTKDKFFLKRKEHVEHICEQLNNYNICLIHSDLGNGKSVFLDYLLSVLVEENRVYLLNDTENIADDLREISKYKTGQSIIVIDDYNQNIGFFREYVRNSYAGIKVIATCRSSMNIFLFDQILNKYGANIEDIFLEDINRLTDTEIDELINLFDIYGLWGVFAALSKSKKEKMIKKDYHRHLAEIFYMLLHSKAIENKLEIIFQKLYDASLKKYVLALAVCDICNFHLRAYEICRLINISMADVEKRAYEKQLLSMFTLREGDIGFRSAIFSQYIIKRIKDNNMLMELIKQIYKRSLPEKKYYMLRRNLNARSTLLHIFQKDVSKPGVPDNEQFLYSYYDSIRPFANDNPFYWLQFAITALNINRFVDARLYFDNAYALAAEMLEFDTFQMDTHYARYLFMEIMAVDEKLDFDKFYQAHRKLMDNSNNNMRLAYVLRQASYYYEIDQKYKNQFDAKHRFRFWQCIDEVAQKFDAYFSYLENRFVTGMPLPLDQSVEKAYLKFKNLLSGKTYEINLLDGLYKKLKAYNESH